MKGIVYSIIFTKFPMYPIKRITPRISKGVMDSGGTKSVPKWLKIVKEGEYRQYYHSNLCCGQILSLLQKNCSNFLLN